MTKYNEIKNIFDNSSNLQWFAVRTYIGKEQLAKLNFENQGFNVYLPMVKALRKHARRVEYVGRAFFSGYLFLHLKSPEINWTTISSTLGAIKPVKFGEHYPAVPNQVIENLRACEDKKGFISLYKINNGKFKSGDRVKINLPEFLDYTGIFKAPRGNDRALILLDLLRKQVSVTVPLSSLSSSWADGS